MRLQFLFLTFALVGSNFAWGDGGNYACKNGSQKADVKTVYSVAGKKVPCEVKYRKDPATDGKAIFHAASEEGFCEKKADEFATKLKGLGWECSAGPASDEM